MPRGKPSYRNNLEVSFIVPVNNLKLFNELQSNLSQTFTGYELIPVYKATSFFEAWERGLAKVSKKYVALIHQDVFFYSFPDLDKIFADGVGMLGVCGSKIITRKEPWFFNFWRLFTGKLSGSIYQSIFGLTRLKWTNRLGECGQAVVLDGVCLITKKDILKKVGIPKTPYANWHFYDHILSTNFIKKGYKLYTVPIGIAHRSLGLSTLSKEFKITKRKFVKEYFHDRREYKI